MTSIPTSAVDKMLAEFKDLTLSGDITSVVATIPYAIGLNSKSQIELVPLPAKPLLHGTLSQISQAGWNHTIVGWTGEVLPEPSSEFQFLKKRCATAADLVTKKVEDAEKLREEEEYNAYSTDFYPQTIAFERLTITQKHRDQVGSLLKMASKNKIIPVWLGSWIEERSPVTLEIPEKQSKGPKGTAAVMLYQALHNETPTAGDKDQAPEAFACYEQLNKCVAEAIIKVYQPGDVIWVHSHQLMLLPEILRMRLPSAFIVYCQHEPWPSAKIFSSMHEHKTLMRGLLGADLIALPDDNVFKDVDAYYKRWEDFTTRRARDFHGHDWELVTAPTHLDYAEVREKLGTKEVKDEEDLLKTNFPGQQLIVAKARMDQAIGIFVILAAFSGFLRDSPTWRSRVVLIFIITPHNSPEHRLLNNATDMADVFHQVREINHKFGSASYQPVVLLEGYRPRAEYLALLKNAAVGVTANNLLTTNSMSREFLIAQEGTFSPLLVATWVETKGHEAKRKSGTLKHAKNANNPLSNQAARISEALEMSKEEKKTRHKSMAIDITEPRISVTEFILTELGGARMQKGVPRGPLPVDFDKVKYAYFKAKERLILFDYDGTLVDIVANPEDAVPSAALIDALQLLVGTPGNYVYIVSGRSRDFLEEHLGHVIGLGLVAEHGSFIMPAQKREWRPQAVDLDMSWQERIQTFFTTLVGQFPGSWVELKEIAMVWHYRQADDHNVCLAAAQKAIFDLEPTLEHYHLSAILGKANLEVRPKFLNKGAVVGRALWGEFKGKTKERFVFCAGDDTTDEDMFREILASSFAPEFCFTCLVSEEEKRASMAQYRIKDPNELLDGLNKIVRY